MSDVDKKLEKLAEERDAAQKAQAEIDKLALADLIEEYDGDVAKVPLAQYRKGLPTFAVVRAPKRTEMKRFQDRVSKDKSKATDAQVQLAYTCLVYPDKDTFEKILERVAAFDVSCGGAALNLSVGKTKEEGKG